MGLSDCFVTVLAYVHYFQVQKETLPPERVREDILALLETGEKLARERGYPVEDYDLARFALCVWIDETVMRSSWPGKAFWKKRLLQRELYKIGDGGVEFYNKLERLEPDQNEVRHVYLLCLSAGFSGRYGASGEETALRDRIRATQLKRLTGSADGGVLPSDELLFAESYRSDYSREAEVKFGDSGLLAVSALFAVLPLALLVSMYVLYRFILNHEMFTAVGP